MMTDHTSRRHSHCRSVPNSPDIIDTLNAMYASQVAADSGGSSNSLSPTSPPSLFTRVKRRLSMRGRHNFGRRKSSQTSLNSLNLDGFFSEVGRKLSSASRDDLCNIQMDPETEHLYRGLLRSVIHPLGAPDATIGLRPGDLADHLREIFDLDRDEHEMFIREELTQKPQDLRLHVTVSEASGLRPADSSSVWEPYCILSLVSTSKHTSRSPKSSPKSSPKVSPKPKRKSSNTSNVSTDSAEVRYTQAAKGGNNPRWNEQVEFDIFDHSGDELQVYVWNNTKDSPLYGSTYRVPSSSEKPHGFKTIFRYIRHSVEHGKAGQDYLGMCAIPLKDIPCNGTEQWFDLIDKCKVTGKLKPAGQIKMKLSISLREVQIEHVDTQDNGDGSMPDGSSYSAATDSLSPLGSGYSATDSSAPVGSGYSATDSYFHALQHMLRHSVKVQRTLHQSASVSTEQIDGSLSTQKRRIMDLFAVSSNISKLSQAMLHLVVILQWSVGHESCHLSKVALQKSLEAVQMAWITMQVGLTEVSPKMPLTDNEISMFRMTAGKYFNATMSNLEIPDLFPPNVESVNILKNKIGVLIQLSDFDLWDKNSSPLKELSAVIVAKIQTDATVWILEQLSQITTEETVKDTVIPEVTTFLDVVNQCSSHMQPIEMIRQFFLRLDIQYYRLISFALESKVSKKARELMQQMDKYQIRYHKFYENIISSSRLSLTLYFALRKMYYTAKEHITYREIFKLTISKYQSWFQESLVFWLQTFKLECSRRLEKALEIDKDMVLVTTLVKYSNSSVDVLSCFSKMTEEWREIKFHDADCVLMGVTKLTDLICDSARLYADKIQSAVLERNCYYDNREGQFDVTDSLCITLNNIEHVRQYLNELPDLLEWQGVVEAISMRHGSGTVGQQSLLTLRRLTKTAHGDMLMKSLILVDKITSRMRLEIQRYMQQFTRLEPEKLSSIDALMHYLSTNTKTLFDRLVGTIYPIFIEHLWHTVLTCFDEQLMVGRPTEYYLTMRRHLRSLSMYFVRGGVEEDKVNTFMCDTLRTRLELNCMSSEDLILQYYKDMADNMGTPMDYYGHLALKTAFMEETRGKVTIFVQVIRASDLPGLDPSGLSDPYVEVSLQPAAMFGHHPTQRTKVEEKTLNPVFNTTFQFTNIPKDHLTVKGAVLLLCVMDHDHIGTDDFAGEVILHLSSIQPIGMHESVDTLQVVMMPVKRPTNQKGAFQVLRERSSWDRTSKTFVTERSKFIENQPTRTDTPNKKSSLFSFFNNLTRTP